MLCYKGSRVKQYVESENSEGKEIKIGFSAYFWNINIWPPLARMRNDTCDVRFIRDSTTEFLAGKFNVWGIWRRQDGAGYFVSSKGFLFTNTHLFYVIDDWLVLEIITQWTGKTIL